MLVWTLELGVMKSRDIPTSMCAKLLSVSYGVHRALLADSLMDANLSQHGTCNC